MPGRAKGNPLSGATVKRDKTYGVPRRVCDIDAPASESEPRQIADAFVERIAPSLRVDPATLRFDRIKPSIFGSHVLYQQYRDGLPISGAWLRLDVAKDGRVFQILNDLIPQQVISKPAGKAQIGARQADARAREAIEARTRRVVEHELVQ
jgi:Fungalysin/Thermolysin Propeptide Motif